MITKFRSQYLSTLTRLMLLASLSTQYGQLLLNWVIYQCSCIIKTVLMQEAQ